MVTKFHFFLAIKSLRRNKSKFHSSIKVNNAGESSQYCSYARTVGFERPITNTSILMHALNKEFLISLCRLVCCPSIVSYCFLIIVHPPHPLILVLPYSLDQQIALCAVCTSIGEISMSYTAGSFIIFFR